MGYSASFSLDSVKQELSNGSPALLQHHALPSISKPLVRALPKARSPRSILELKTGWPWLRRSCATVTSSRSIMEQRHQNFTVRPSDRWERCGPFIDIDSLTMFLLDPASRTL